MSQEAPALHVWVHPPPEQLMSQLAPDSQVKVQCPCEQRKSHSLPAVHVWASRTGSPSVAAGSSSDPVRTLLTQAAPVHESVQFAPSSQSRMQPPPEQLKLQLASAAQL